MPIPSFDTVPTLDTVLAAHRALRQQQPLVQCLTNTVSTNFMANALLAAGASPAMVDNPEEAGFFAGIAGAVLINLGTPTAAQVASMRLAAAAAQAAGKPWVIDPIAAGGLPWRGGVAVELLAHRPAIIRGNASEIIGLAGLGGSARGVDSSADPSQAIRAAVDLTRHAAVVSASGAIDHVVGSLDEGSAPVLIRISGGSPMLPRVTASGCALGALAAAYAAVAETPFIAMVAAHAHMSVAAEIAARTATGPGTFAAAFLDGLDAVDTDAFRALAKIGPVETI